eukprot:3835297-Prymnesium_polylepis.1
MAMQPDGLGSRTRAQVVLGHVKFNISATFSALPELHSFDLSMSISSGSASAWWLNLTALKGVITLCHATWMRPVDGHTWQASRATKKLICADERRDVALHAAHARVVRARTREACTSFLRLEAHQAACRFHPPCVPRDRVCVSSGQAWSRPGQAQPRGTGLLRQEASRLWIRLRSNENDSDKNVYGSLDQRDERSVMA